MLCLHASLRSLKAALTLDVSMHSGAVRVQLMERHADNRSVQL